MLQTEISLHLLKSNCKVTLRVRKEEGEKQNPFLSLTTSLLKLLKQIFNAKDV